MSDADTTPPPQAPALTARVARLLDKQKLVVNKGSDHGVALQQRFVIFEKGDEITDPDTGESLGALELVKAHGEVIHVQERMAILRLELPKRERAKTLSEIMASLSGVDEESERVAEVKVGDYARLE
jgi:hypothetical protein